MSQVNDYKYHFTGLKIRLTNIVDKSYTTLLSIITDQAESLSDILQAFFLPPPIGIPYKPYEEFLDDKIKVYYKKLYPYPINVTLFDNKYFKIVFGSQHILNGIDKLTQDDINFINNYKFEIDASDKDIEEAYIKFISSTYYQKIIRSYYTKYEDLTDDTSNKYLELKSKLETVLDIDFSLFKSDYINLISAYHETTIIPNLKALQSYIIRNIDVKNKKYFYGNYKDIELKAVEIIEEPERDTPVIWYIVAYAILLLLLITVILVGIALMIYSIVISPSQIKIIIMGVLLLLFIIFLITGIVLSYYLGKKYILIFILFIFCIIFIIAGIVFLFVQF